MIKRAIYTVLKWFGRSPVRMKIHGNLDYEIKDLSTGTSTRYTFGQGREKEVQPKG